MSLYRQHLAELENDTSARDDGSNPTDTAQGCQEVDLTVHVANEVTGWPLRDAGVTLETGPSAPLNGQTDCNGNVTFSAIVPGYYDHPVSYEALYQKMADRGYSVQCGGSNASSVRMVPIPATLGTRSQTDISVFFSQYENSHRIPATTLQALLTEPSLLERHRALIREMIRHVKCQKPPLTLEAFFQMARGVAGSDSVALMMCHNVSKALARGLSPINWSNLSRTPLAYDLNGERHEFDLSAVHADALPNTGGRNSAFYLFFSATELGTDDTGDWYHFYANAYASHAGAASTVTFDVDDEGRIFGGYRTQVAGAISDIISEMITRSGASDIGAYRGWRWANSLSFLEGAAYGTDHGGSQTETSRESDIHRRGAVFGLAKAGEAIRSAWRWYVPVPGSVRPIDLDFRADLDDATETFAELNADGTTLNTSNDEGSE